MLSRHAELRSQSLLLFVLLLSVLLLGGRASASTIAYDIFSLENVEESPFSGIFTRGSGDDDDGEKHGRSGHDDDDEGRESRILSDDLRGLIGLATDDSVLFLDGQELLVEQFSLAGTGSFCRGCRELAVSIELDPRFDSVLVVDEGRLAGEIRLLLMLDGFEEKELTLSARAETADPESNFATPEFLSLLLELDFLQDVRQRGFDDDDDDRERRLRDDDEGDWERHLRDDDDDWKTRLRDDDDGDWKRRLRDDDDRLFLQAQGPIVPEPGTFLLLGGGLLVLASRARRRLQSSP